MPWLYFIYPRFFAQMKLLRLVLNLDLFFQIYIVRTSRSRWSEHFLSKVDKIETKLVVFNTALLVLSFINTVVNRFVEATDPK